MVVSVILFLHDCLQANVFEVFKCYLTLTFILKLWFKQSYFSLSFRLPVSTLMSVRESTKTAKGICDG